MDLNLPNETSPNSYQLPFNWRTVGCLFGLFAIPGIPAIFITAMVIAGAISPTLITPLINASYYETPLAIIVHGMSGVVFFVTMPLQFSPKLRSKQPRYHKINGYFAFMSGCIMAVSGVWMQYAFAPEIIDARLISNLVVALFICVCFCMAIKFAIARKIKQHMQWIYYATAACLAVITPLFFDIFMLSINTLVSDTYEGITLMLADYGRLIALMTNLVLAHWFYSKQHAK